MTTIGGLSDVLLIVGPKSEQRTGSLLFYWHTTASSAQGEISRLVSPEWREDLLAKGGIIAALQSSTMQGGDCSGTAAFSHGDFEVADQIAACAVRDHGIDPHRIYATGCGAGGFQAGCMAALRSSYLAAVVTNSGGLVSMLPFQTTHVPPAMTIHSTSSSLPLIDVAQTSKLLGEHFTKAGGFAIGCSVASAFCLPGPELQNLAWRFMKDHAFGVDPEPYASGLPAAFSEYCRAFE